MLHGLPKFLTRDLAPPPKLAPALPSIVAKLRGEGEVIVQWMFAMSVGPYLGFNAGRGVRHFFFVVFPSLQALRKERPFETTEVFFESFLS